MNQELVSVILPTYNRAAIIKRTVESVLNQTYSNWELIIVDDGSTDNTEEVIRQFDDDRIIYLKNEINRGANYARNRGCGVAHGIYVAFIDSDNIWTRNKLEMQVEVLNKANNSVAFVFSRVKFVEGEKNTIIPNYGFNINNLITILKHENVIDTNVVLMRKDIFCQVGGFDERMPRLQDYDLFFKVVVIEKYNSVFIEDVLDINYIQQNSISRDNVKLQNALILFMNKYRDYLSPEELTSQFLILTSSIDDAASLDNCISGVSELFYEHNAVCELMKKLCCQTKYYETLFKWKENLEKKENRTIFNKYANYKVIAIYGLGRWGEAIYNELKNNDVKITYGIDKNVSKFHDIEVLQPNNVTDTIDLIIVSVFQQYKEIYTELRSYFHGEIVSIKEIICDN